MTEQEYRTQMLRLRSVFDRGFIKFVRNKSAHAIYRKAIMKYEAYQLEKSIDAILLLPDKSDWWFPKPGDIIKHMPRAIKKEVAASEVIEVTDADRAYARRMVDNLVKGITGRQELAH